MIRPAGQLLAVLLAGFYICSAQGQEFPADAVKAVRELAASVVSAKSTTGRFSAVGADRIAVYDFIRWVEDLSERYQSVTGFDLPNSRVPIIRVFFTEDEAVQDTVMSFSGRVEDDVLTHSVNVVNYESGAVEQLMASVSACLTATVIFSMQDGRAGEVSITMIPNWFAAGIAQNMYAGQRKRNSEKMTSLWKEGKMVPLRSILAADETDGDPEVMKMAHGLFVGWLLSFGKDANLIGHVCDEILEDGEPDVEDVMAILKAEGVSDPGAGWDMWMLRQDRIVYLPGGTTMKDLSWLKAQLLLYPDDFGISLPVGLPKKLVCEDLIALKDNSSIREVLKTRFVEMQLKGAGKGHEFRGVIDAYCRFFDGVIKEKADWRLKRYLTDAEKRLRDFEIRTLSARLKEKGELESERDSNEEDE